jgi:OFA family oxalate/formate antiporter-like MFS transporter
MQIKGLGKLEQARWVILAAATLGMMFIGLYQYSWTLFVKPIGNELKTNLVAVQLTFTIFTTIMTFTQPLAGMVADKRGPFYLNLLGGAISGAGLVASSYANSVETLYLTYGIGSIGVGILYATAVGAANKWFPDRRGLATGFASFGYGFGAAVVNPLLSSLIG